MIVVIKQISVINLHQSKRETSSNTVHLSALLCKYFCFLVGKTYAKLKIQFAQLIKIVFERARKCY